MPSICSAITKSGAACKKQAVKDTNLCKFHDGSMAKAKNEKKIKRVSASVEESKGSTEGEFTFKPSPKRVNRPPLPNHLVSPKKTKQLAPKVPKMSKPSAPPIKPPAPPIKPIEIDEIFDTEMVDQSSERSQHKSHKSPVKHALSRQTLKSLGHQAKMLSPRRKIGRM